MTRVMNGKARSETNKKSPRYEHKRSTWPHHPSLYPAFFLPGTESWDTWLLSTHLAYSVNATIWYVADTCEKARLTRRLFHIACRDEIPNSLLIHVLYSCWFTYAFHFLLSYAIYNTPCHLKETLNQKMRGFETFRI